MPDRHRRGFRCGVILGIVSLKMKKKCPDERKHLWFEIGGISSNVNT